MGVGAEAVSGLRDGRAADRAIGLGFVDKSWLREEWGREAEHSGHTSRRGRAAVPPPSRMRARERTGR